jgi:hypothetical protein
VIRSRSKQPDVTAPEPPEAAPETVPDDLGAVVGQLRAEAEELRAPRRTRPH